ncbi:MAG: ribosomal protein S18-alanine N-acetyltransferase [Caldimonas sp.]
MSACFDLSASVLRPMSLAGLDGVMALEMGVYPFPWSRGNFVDSLAAHYTAWTLNRPTGELLGYCVAMAGVAEMHLLNITVAPAVQRHGHARRMLAALVRLCATTGADRLWLEVRASNGEARAAYARLGFSEVGLRKGYYPAPGGRREDAVVMSLDVAAAEGEHALD